MHESSVRALVEGNWASVLKDLLLLIQEASARYLLQTCRSLMVCTTENLYTREFWKFACLHRSQCIIR